ncbi:MAG TPA: hypothetical protein VHK28_03745 [Candidatus Limnocylindria bacterium]|nr:hypothetical protein [Candidatus Limnocylindria bacterium]
MLVIQSVRRIWGELNRLPAIARLGLWIMSIAAAIDIVVHALGGGQAAHGLPLAHGAHLLGITGMTLVWASVVLDGVRHQPTRRAIGSAKPGGPSRDAHR